MGAQITAKLRTILHYNSFVIRFGLSSSKVKKKGIDLKLASDLNTLDAKRHLSSSVQQQHEKKNQRNETEREREKKMRAANDA